MELLYRLGWTLLQSLWQGAIIAVVLAVLLPALARRSAQVRYAVLIAAMFAISVAFIATFLCSPTKELSSPPRSVAMSATPAALHSQATAPSPAIRSAEPALSEPPPQRAPERLVSSAWWAALLGQSDWLCQTAGKTWLIGVLLLGAWRALAWFSVRRLVALKSSPANPTLWQTARRLAMRLDLSQHFELLISCFTETPMVIGWLRPVILIPTAAITGLSPTQLEAILAHELAHIRRHDYLVNLLQIVVETLLFYHPAIWWISRRIRLEREQACDDIAVSMCGDRQAYARSLAAVEELRMAGSPALAAGGAGGRQMLLRIRRILRPADHARPWGIPASLSLSLIAVIAVAGFTHLRRARADQPSPTTRPFSLQNTAPRLSPFTAVRWQGNSAQVQYQGTWYAPVSIDDVLVDQIMAYLNQSKDFAPRKHFAEDLVEVMTAMGHPTGAKIKLVMEKLDAKDGQVVTIPDAVMTEENRKSVLQFDAAVDTSRTELNIANSELDGLEAQHQRLATLLDRYTVELRNALTDVKNMDEQLTQLGGESVGQDGCPKAMELKRWVQEQIDLQTQKLTIDVEADQFNDKKSKGAIPPPIERQIESDSDVVRCKQALESAKVQAASAPADGGPASAWLQAAQQHYDTTRADVTDKAMNDYESDLNWRKQNIDQRLAKVNENVARLSDQMAEIATLSSRLASRSEDLTDIREKISRYDNELEELDTDIRAVRSKPPQPGDPPAAPNNTAR